MKKNFLSIAALVLVSFFGIAHGETVRILSSNDMHSAIEKMPQYAAIVDSIRAIDPFVLVISAGDNRTGNPYNDLYEPVSYPMISMMNLIGFDASALGNHEYDSKVEGLAKVISLSNFPYLAANITCPPESGIRVRPYMVFDVKGIKVGVLGITQVGDNGLPDTHPDNVKGLSFQLPEEVIPQYKWLTEQCDVNVLLTHVGFDVDIELAKQFPYYDLIISSHTHTQLEGGEIHSGVLITQNGYQLPRVTLTTLEVEGGKVVSKKAENIYLNNPNRHAEAAEALLKHFKNSPEMERVVGYFKNDINGYDPLGVMMCDAWLEECECDIALENYGGVRYDYIKAGPITVKDILNLDPFLNCPVVMTLTGKKLNMKKKYRVVTNNYVASIADSPRQDQGVRGDVTTSDLITHWLEKKGTVDYQGRSSFTEKW